MEILPNGDIRLASVLVDSLTPEAQHYLATCSKEELDALALSVRDDLVESFIDDFLAPLKAEIENSVTPLPTEPAAT